MEPSKLLVSTQGNHCLQNIIFSDGHEVVIRLDERAVVRQILALRMVLARMRGIDVNDVLNEQFTNESQNPT